MEYSADELLNKQGDIGGKISRLTENFKKSIAKTKMTAGDVQARIQLLEEYWTTFQKHHDLLTYRHNDTVKKRDYSKTGYADGVEEAYLRSKSQLLDLSRQFGEGGPASPGKGAAAPSSGEHSSESAPLPRMQLPEFDGDYMSWPGFKDLFKSIVERNRRFSEVDRLHYLKGCLHGKAADLVKDLVTTNENYGRAWAILEEQYENKRILVRSCLDKLASIPKMRESTAAEITNVHKGIISVVNTLEGLGRPIDKTEDWFVYSVVNLLDPLTRDKWEERIAGSIDPPSFVTLKDFLNKRRQQLEASPDSGSTGPVQCPSNSQVGSMEARSSKGQPRPKEGAKFVRANHAQQSTKFACAKCGKGHYLMQCHKYKALPPTERRGLVEKLHRCANCLGSHSVESCPSSRSCWSCGEKHHSSIHDAFQGGASPKKTAHHTLDCQNMPGKVLLATALIKVADRFGRRQTVRALIDQGSEVTMVSEGLVQRLQLPRTASSVDVFGVGGQQLAKVRGRVSLNVGSNEGDALKVSALVLPRLSTYAIDHSTPLRKWSHLQGLQLADPSPDDAKPIEVLLGADVYAGIIREGVRKGATNEPVGQLTSFGWIITGMTGSSAESAHVQVHQAVIGDSLTSLVRNFWEQEELREVDSTPTAEEEECERHFVSTHSRTKEGRHQVRLPFQKLGPLTPGSRRAGWHALRRMKQRFRRDESFKALYINFVKEYQALGHMSLVSEPAVDQQVHYLPHHGVLKPSSTTTKLRVVFNGSWSEPSQPSLNDCLHVGPNLLPLLADVLLRWRKHQYVEDRNHQRILWRDDETHLVSELQLNTVTYGLSCAPYLAVRTLHQLAEDEGSCHPLGAQALRHDSYVDDILTGADTVPALRETALQLHQLCKAGGFPLQKWVSNVPDLHNVTPQPCQESATQPSLHEAVQEQQKTWTDPTHSTLGLQWSPREDCFQYTISDEREQPFTKRGVVSKAAQLFDPLGWLTPVVVRAKITIQSTWLLALGWDDPLPATLAKEWTAFCAELKELEKVRVPRPLFFSIHHKQRELHGFADASKRAYGAVLYLGARDAENRWRVSLVTAKSKVAPLQQVSLPRLELCAAHLLARLTQHTVTTLYLNDTAVHLWSDDTVALGWIQAHPSRWKTYVANRVADIQRRIQEAQWWWDGPEFLHQDDSFIPSDVVDPEQLPEARGPIVAAVVKGEKAEDDNLILQRFSSYSRLLHVTAWCRRWLRRRHDAPSPPATNAGPLQTTQPPVLSVTEVVDAERCWIKLVQQSAYKAELTLLATGQCVPSRNSLAPLLPTLDSSGLMRVGGRLSKAQLSPDETHPIILPPDSKLTELLISCIHRTTLHGGVQATLGAVRQRFWIPKGRSKVKAVINRCVTCLRWRAEPASQLMGQLPEHRVTPARPFHSTGVDYAGPIWLRTTSGRGHTAYKGFLAVFVCMVTKAVHLEVVSNYTSEAFLAAFRRFVSRRGICAHLYSDCGTNFIGADRELRRLFTASSQENRSLRSHLCDLRIQWHFNPPAAPHFGGLWEAAVKSTKYHLRRTIGETRLTFEEMSTLLTQVEACLNSRPLAALSDDPADLTALTPGHFLIGSALNALPEPSLLDIEVNRLTRWQLLTRMKDQFWMRWQKEYLHGLTTRSRWRQLKEDLEPGRLCIIAGETTPPSQWPLARVMETHPGADGKVRVVKLVTATTELVRPVSKIIALPIDAKESMDASISSPRTPLAHHTTA